MGRRGQIQQGTPLAWFGVAAVLLVLLLVATNTPADITSDGSLATVVNRNGSDFDIRGGTAVGSNLFHSFGVFDIHTGETATFNGPASVARILSRVTGGSSSTIDGTLRSAIAGADLYLINPAGVVFGPNAVLDVQGSFHVSTANYLTLGSDGRFDVSHPRNSVLTVSAPSAFGFVSNTPAPIDFNGSFIKALPGETLSVIGGDVNLNDASLYANKGRINIASVASPGQVVPTTTGLDTNNFSRLGDIRVSQSTDFLRRPRLSNGEILGNIETSADNSAGDIYIRGGQFELDNGWVFSDTDGSGPPGKVDIAITGELRLKNQGKISTDTKSAGAGGDVVIDAESVVLESGGQIVANARGGSGDAGNVTINATKLLSVSGSSSQAEDRRLLPIRQYSAIQTLADKKGEGGAITISAGHISLSEEGEISVRTDGPGDAGSVLIHADEVDVSGAARIDAKSVNEGQGTGRGGAVTIHANRVSLRDAGQISVSTDSESDAGSVLIHATEIAITGGAVVESDTQGTGNGGEIVLNASATVTVSGEQSAIRSTTSARGDGGRISVEANRVVVADQGAIQANLESDPRLNQPAPDRDTRAGEIAIRARNLEVSGGAQVTSDNVTQGQGGDIRIAVTELVQLSGSSDNGSRPSGLFSTTAGRGSAGSVQVSATDLSMEGLASINTSSIGAGDAGTTVIETALVSLNNGARVTSSTSGDGDGGQVTLRAEERIHASGLGSDGIGSGFYSDVEAAAAGDGGTILLAAPAITLDDGANVSARTRGSGNAGTITINAGQTLKLQNAASITTASTESGPAGSVQVSATELSMDQLAAINSSTLGAGDAGTIQVEATRVSLSNGARVTSSTGGAGDGGQVTVRAKETMHASGIGSDGIGSGFYSDVTVSVGGTEGDASGRGGSIDLRAADIRLSQQATVSANNDGGGAAGTISIQAGEALTLTEQARVTSETSGAGSGGNIGLAAQVVLLDERANVSARSDGSGDAGRIEVDAGSTLTLSQGALISTAATDVGNAGGITISSGETVELVDASSITTESLKSGGGKISINTRDLLYLRDSKITSSVADGVGNGGDISIDPEFVILDSSQILAQADAGNGGNILIVANHFFATPDSSVDASSKLGIDGVVEIRSPVTDLTASLTKLPESFLNAAAWLKQRCAARAGGSASSFVVAGSGGVPAAPDDLLYASVAAPAGIERVGQAKIDLKQLAPEVVSAGLSGQLALLLGCGS